MIRTCIVCGKQFEGRGNKKVCSGICRLENKRLYQAQYRKLYPEKCKKTWNDCYHKKREAQRKLDIKITPDPKPKRKKQPMPDIYKSSEWGKDYYRADRLTQISMLSGELSKYEIANVSYGYLSAIFESGRYFSLLKQILSIKAEERRSNEIQSQE